MTKNGEGRVVYLTPELRGLLADQLERVDAAARRSGQIIPWLFPYLRGRRRLGQRRRTFAKAWEKACEKVGVPGRLLHTSAGRPSGTSSVRASPARWP